MAAQRKRQDLSAALQDYLEVILDLEKEKGGARVRDIAQAASVHKSTVTAALHTLSGKGLIDYAPYEIATLTEEGRRLAEDVTQRHQVIGRFLKEILLVDGKAAEENACRMEHAIDPAVLDRLARFARFVKRDAGSADDWAERFGAYLGSGATQRE